MPMESPVKVFSPQNTAGVSEKKGVPVILEVNGAKFQKANKYVIKPKKCLHTAPPM